MENEVKYEEVEIKQKVVRTDSYFDGSLIELIAWRILGILVTGVTLGIGKPWADCMIYSYKYKHTVYNGKRLKFEGTGGDLFVNRFKWIIFTIFTFGIYLFLIPVRKTRWIISNLHFEEEPFVKDESYFDGKTIQLIGVNILCNILNFVSLGLLFPFTICYKLRWISKHTIINRKRITFNGKAINLFGKFILWVFLTIITFGIYSFWLGIKMLKWQTKNTHLKIAGEEQEKNNVSYFVVLPVLCAIFLILLGVSSIIFSYLKEVGVTFDPKDKNFIITRIFNYDSTERACGLCRTRGDQLKVGR